MPDVLQDDHARGCAGREYACTCGYDDRLAAEVERLRAENLKLRLERNIVVCVGRATLDALARGDAVKPLEWVTLLPADDFPRTPDNPSA